jgi:serine/threonine-protein kinase
MSPEQAAGDVERLGPSSDIYGLGATLYCLLTGKPPFEGEDVGAVLGAVQEGRFPQPTRLDPSLDPALDAVCLKAMALKPSDRYPSPRALAEDVDRWMADEPVSAGHEPLAVPGWRWTRRHRTAVTATAASPLAGLIGLAAVASVTVAAAERIYREKLAANRARNEAVQLQRAADAQRTRAEEQKALADRHAEAARKAQEEAGQQAQLGLGTIYDVVTTADEKPLSRAEMGPLRVELLQLVMKNLDQISRQAATSSTADRTMGVALQKMGGSTSRWA